MATAEQKSNPLPAHDCSRPVFLLTNCCAEIAHMLPSSGCKNDLRDVQRLENAWQKNVL